MATYPYGTPVLITNPDGSDFYSCTCMATWWPLVNQLAVRRGIVSQCVDVTQGSYNTSVSASASTHAGGGVLDLAQYSTALDDLLEEAGAASYVRTPEDGFSYHTHMILIGCPHLHPQAQDQVDAWMARRNGLVSNAPDRDQTRPLPIRTSSQGVTWLQSQLTTEDIMLQTDFDKIAEIVRTTANAVDVANQKRIDNIAAAANLAKDVVIANQQRIDRNHAATLAAIAAIGQAAAGDDMTAVIAAAEAGAERGAREALAAGIEVNVKAAD